MSVTTKDLWSLTWGNPQVDATDLASAVERQVISEDLDYRSRLLVRDSVQALRRYWGEERVAAWLANSSVGHEIEAICKGPWDDDRGFGSLASRVVDVTKPETIRQFIRELSLNVHGPVRLGIGGSAALILRDQLVRKTDDVDVVDVVDELPAPIRNQHALLEQLASRYGLSPTHFQRHYLPAGWENRLQYFDTYGQVRIYLVDTYDIALGKLFSARSKDLDDIRMVMPQLDKSVLAQKLRETAHALLSARDLRHHAERNWYILFGEALPA